MFDDGRLPTTSVGPKENIGDKMRGLRQTEWEIGRKERIQYMVSVKAVEITGLLLEGRV